MRSYWSKARDSTFVGLPLISLALAGIRKKIDTAALLAHLVVADAPTMGRILLDGDHDLHVSTS